MICSQCKKEFTQFHRSEKYCSKECFREYRIEYQKKYQESDKSKEKSKKYQQSEIGKKTHKKYRQSVKHKEYVSKYIKEKRKSDPIFKLTGSVRTRLNNFLSSSNIRKTNSTFKMVGCTPEFLKEYLEKQFKPGMTWQNYTRKGWHIDHRTPLDSAKTPKDIEKLMHYTNLQPMWAIENISKSNK